MRRPLVTLLAATAASLFLAAGPAVAHDRAGSAPSKPRKIRVALKCAPVAAAEAPAIRCRWSSAGPDKSYALYRKTARARTPVLVLITGDQAYEDPSVAAGTWFAYRVRVLDATGRTLATSKQVKVWCCGRPGANPGAATGAQVKPRPEAEPKVPAPGPVKPAPSPTPLKPAPVPAPAGASLTLGCEPAGATAVACSWSGVPADAVVKYRLHRKAPGGTPAVLATLAPDASSYVDAGVHAAATYSYAVEAYGRDGWVVRSAIVTAGCCP